VIDFDTLSIVEAVEKYRFSPVLTFFIHAQIKIGVNR
jgi:hypothetical protein